MVNKEVKDFNDLNIYQLANELADFIYNITESFPREEKFNLVSQLRRAATSIGANIAEGFGRYHYKENIQFCRQARGSLLEVKHFILFSHKRNFIDQDTLDKFLKDYITLKVKLNNYINSIGPVS